MAQKNLPVVGFEPQASGPTVHCSTIYVISSQHFQVRPFIPFPNLENLNEFNFSIFYRAYDGTGGRRKSLTLHEHQFAPFELYDDQGVDGFIRGLTTQPAQEFDPKFSKEVSCFKS